MGQGNDKIHIDLRETIAALVGFMTFQTWLTERKSIMQSDNSGCTFCLNKLHSSRKSMSSLCDIYEQLLDRFDAECLIEHCPGKKNKWSDACSQHPEWDILRLLYKFNKEVGMEHLKLEELRATTQLQKHGPHCHIDLKNPDRIMKLGNGDTGPFNE